MGSTVAVFFLGEPGRQSHGFERSSSGVSDVSAAALARSKLSSLSFSNRLNGFDVATAAIGLPGLLLFFAASGLSIRSRPVPKL